MMFLSGQYDLLVNVAMTEAFLMSVNWKGLLEYRVADKVVWRVKPNDSEPAGYVRRAKNLFQVMVRGAGHGVYEEQRERVFDLLQRFINDTPFS
ncbi:probable serine carboxypeptidase CPVL [Gigantopelta aegis]|uniref:probable serine carboxypeptidase CPVL n=1 Tax=Gigantopelta aegis TaxID=1735272 RepID=UPI001B88BC18|nr:probable serine carboxypeptidase CPVL [Gigantopelta aegis]